MANVKHFNINGTTVDVCDDTARTLAQTASSAADEAKTIAQQALENSGGTLTYSSGTETITWTQGGVE